MFSLIRSAVERGVTFFDTAEVYGPFTNENSSAKQRISHWKIDENTKFDSTDFRNTVPLFSPEARKANQALVDLIGEFAAQKKATSAQIALAWCLPRNLGLRRFREPQNCMDSKKILARLMWN